MNPEAITPSTRIMYEASDKYHDEEESKTVAAGQVEDPDHIDAEHECRCGSVGCPHQALGKGDNPIVNTNISSSNKISTFLKEHGVSTEKLQGFLFGALAAVGLGLALLTPVGWVATGLVLAAAAAVLLYSIYKMNKATDGSLGDKIKDFAAGGVVGTLVGLPFGFIGVGAVVAGAFGAGLFTMLWNTGKKEKDDVLREFDAKKNEFKTAIKDAKAFLKNNSEPDLEDEVVRNEITKHLNKMKEIIDNQILSEDGEAFVIKCMNQLVMLSNDSELNKIEKRLNSSDLTLMDIESLRESLLDYKDSFKDDVRIDPLLETLNDKSIEMIKVGLNVILKEIEDIKDIKDPENKLNILNGFLGDIKNYEVLAQSLPADVKSDGLKLELQACKENINLERSNGRSLFADDEPLIVHSENLFPNFEPSTLAQAKESMQEDADKFWRGQPKPAVPQAATGKYINPYKQKEADKEFKDMDELLANLKIDKRLAHSLGERLDSCKKQIDLTNNAWKKPFVELKKEIVEALKSEAIRFPGSEDDLQGGEAAAGVEMDKKVEAGDAALVAPKPTKAEVLASIKYDIQQCKELSNSVKEAKQMGNDAVYTLGMFKEKSTFEDLQSDYDKIKKSRSELWAKGSDTFDLSENVKNKKHEIDDKMVEDPEIKASLEQFVKLQDETKIAYNSIKEATTLVEKCAEEAKTFYESSWGRMWYGPLKEDNEPKP